MKRKNSFKQNSSRFMTTVINDAIVTFPTKKDLAAISAILAKTSDTPYGVVKYTLTLWSMMTSATSSATSSATWHL